MKYPVRCKIIDAEGQSQGGFALRNPEASIPYVGMEGMARRDDRLGPGLGVTITLDNGVELHGEDCWWEPIDGEVAEATEEPSRDDLSSAEQIQLLVDELIKAGVPGSAFVSQKQDLFERLFKGNEQDVLDGVNAFIDALFEGATENKFPTDDAGKLTLVAIAKYASRLESVFTTGGLAIFIAGLMVAEKDPEISAEILKKVREGLQVQIYAESMAESVVYSAKEINRRVNG